MMDGTQYRRFKTLEDILLIFEWWLTRQVHRDGVSEELMFLFSGGWETTYYAGFGDLIYRVYLW
jgi:hypothetical protein